MFFGHRRRDTWLMLASAAGFAVLAALMLSSTGTDLLQEVDDAWNAWMWNLEGPVLVGFAKFVSNVGSSVVMIPVRIGIAAWLLVRRSYAALVGWLVVAGLSEAAVHVLKGAFDRARPPGQLVATASAAYPSGHVAGATTAALALVLVLTLPGPARLPWKVAAYTYIVLMAWSRTYLHAHWLSDVVGGALGGAVIVVGTFLAVEAWTRHSSAVSGSASSPAVSGSGSSPAVSGSGDTPTGA